MISSASEKHLNTLNLIRQRLINEWKLMLSIFSGVLIATILISGAPIYLWDDIHVDHTVPLALKGKDEIDNMVIAHGKENREKGA